jgi:hypothetical protein
MHQNVDKLELPSADRSSQFGMPPRRVVVWLLLLLTALLFVSCVVLVLRTLGTNFVRSFDNIVLFILHVRCLMLGHLG